MPHKLRSIQALRGIAAMLVFLGHALARLHQHTADPAWTELVALGLGDYGVYIFFVISGYIMLYTSHDSFEKPGASLIFLEKRLTRIVPLYFIMTAIEYILRVHKDGQFYPLYLLKSLLFIPFYNPLFGHMQPLLAQGWTLNCEMFFYATFAISLFLPLRWGVSALTAAFLGLAALGAGTAPTATPGLLGFYSNPIILLFAAGVGLGYVDQAFLRDRSAVRWSCGATIALAIAVAGLLQLRAFFFPNMLGQPLDTVLLSGMAMISVGLCSGEKAQKENGLTRFCVALGDASYSIYLCHGFIVTIFFKINNHFGDRLPLAGFILLSGAATILIGFAVHRWIEVPVTQLLRARASLSHRNQAFIG